MEHYRCPVCGGYLWKVQQTLKGCLHQRDTNRFSAECDACEAEISWTNALFKEHRSPPLTREDIEKHIEELRNRHGT